ncbi:6,7-dimethyl-8-ribityllumazine synthase [Saezia sanguinis]|uniref:6,7-dimethyl-8-ribityllumazine synthase n=1 Tax=Saezia sanguinis TaxID=1965230 RepID=UPI003048270F
MQNADKGNNLHLQGQGLRIGIVQSRFNTEITGTLAKAAQAELVRLGVSPQDILLIQVAGALEIPVMLQALAKQGAFDALIALGCVIRGETYHFELVANESAAGVTRVTLDHGIPVANAILTTENEAQARARMQEKGLDAAQVAIEMAQLLKQHSVKAGQ